MPTARCSVERVSRTSSPRTPMPSPRQFLDQLAEDGGASRRHDRFCARSGGGRRRRIFDEEIDVDRELAAGDALPRFLAACGLDPAEVERAVDAAQRRLRLAGSARIRARSHGLGPRWEISGPPSRGVCARERTPPPRRIDPADARLTSPGRADPERAAKRGSRTSAARDQARWLRSRRSCTPARARSSASRCCSRTRRHGPHSAARRGAVGPITAVDLAAAGAPGAVVLSPDHRRGNGPRGALRLLERRRSSSYSFLWLWVAVFSAYFFCPLALAAHLAFAAAVYALVLAPSAARRRPRGALDRHRGLHHARERDHLEPGPLAPSARGRARAAARPHDRARPHRPADRPAQSARLARPARRRACPLGAARRRAICVAMLDLDHFKRFNDEHGHVAGDAFLRQLASEWRPRSGPATRSPATAARSSRCCCPTAT